MLREVLKFFLSTAYYWYYRSQAEPNLIDAPEVSVNVSGTVSKVWFASPDVNRGVAQNLQFVQTGNNVTVTLPSLKYWDMIVVEY